MKAKEIRSTFLDYFKNSGHTEVPSSSLVPENDPTLLFINAGMNQFKSLFMGLEKRDYTRATSSQKCVRAGGKHNDLENVGHTARHHTFFEMLGNFSFGDYFKKEAIHYSWDFLTNKMNLPKDRLYITLFDDDDETAEIWHKQQGVPKDRIYRFGEKDNFWRMGDRGPCGPCSEIFWDMGPEVGGDPKQNVMGGEGDRYVEIWNLVFMQFCEDGKGGREPLPNPSVDTGMGLERLTAVMQNEINNYHTDLFQNIISSAANKTGKEYLKNTNKLKGAELATAENTNIALRVLADHARASAFLIADGVLPSNEGRGYVLRRIMRRAIRYGRQLSPDDGLFPIVVQSVITEMNDYFGELKQQQSLITTTVKDEEKRFLQTLDQGTGILSDELSKLEAKGIKTLSGESIFKLYDTYGFPVDLTGLMAKEQGFEVDETSFEKHMEQAKEKARKSWKIKSIPSDTAHLIKFTQDLKNKTGPSEFHGYDSNLWEGKVIGLSNGSKPVTELKTGETGLLVFNQTCFYAESGGQAGDVGQLSSANGSAEVLDCSKQNDIFLHQVKVTDGIIKTSDLCQQQVISSVRRDTASNHSATHLLHAALREVLGDHVTQAGSQVDAERLRFDFTHNKPLTSEELTRAEELVNEQIANQLNIETSVMTPKQASDVGALALFGEKYGDKVRVLKMGEFSIELCGGTHLENTAMIRLFKIVSEGGVSAGVRRIEAISGNKALTFLNKHAKENSNARDFVGLSNNWSMFLLEDPKRGLIEKLELERDKIKSLERQLHNTKTKQIRLEDFTSSGIEFKKDGVAGTLVKVDLEIDDRKVLSEIGDRLKTKIGSGIVIVIGKGEDSHPIIVNVTKNLSKSLPAGMILKEVAEIMGGKGGGRPEFAQGAGKDRSKISEAFDKAVSLLP